MLKGYGKAYNYLTRMVVAVTPSSRGSPRVAQAFFLAVGIDLGGSVLHSAAMGVADHCARALRVID